MRIANVLLELSGIQWDVVYFCERRATSADLILDGGHRLIAHRGESYGGVSILLHAELADAVVKQCRFGDRVLAVRLHKDGFKFTIISVYMPHAGYEDSVLETTYEDLCAALDWGYKFNRSVAVGGDFSRT